MECCICNYEDFVNGTLKFSSAFIFVPSIILLASLLTTAIYVVLFGEWRKEVVNLSAVQFVCTVFIKLIVLKG
jgi:hypothetical protein